MTADSRGKKADIFSMKLIFKFWFCNYLGKYISLHCGNISIELIYTLFIVVS